MSLEGNASVPLNAMALDDVGDDLSLDVNLLPILSRPPRRYDPHERSPAPRTSCEQRIPAVNGIAPPATPERSQMRDDNCLVGHGMVSTRQDEHLPGASVSQPFAKRVRAGNSERRLLCQIWVLSASMGFQAATSWVYHGSFELRW